MKTKVAAGLLMYRKSPGLEVFLVHFGGPFWKNKDNGAWHIPKGLAEPDEDLLACARREFMEETGLDPETAQTTDLGTAEYNGKKIHIWAFKGELPEDFVLKSNPTPQGWPENDKGQFFPIETAFLKILPAQKIFLERLRSLT
jgi:predicted NUDIX family NTP pyrophosphohydrolase